MTAILTSAPVRKPVQGSRPVPRQPRPLPGWLQIGILLLLIQSAVHPPDALNRALTENAVTGVVNGSHSLYSFAYTYDLASNVLTIGESGHASRSASPMADGTGDK